MVLAITGILVSLILLITLAYRGMPVVIAAPIAATVAVLLSGAPILATYTEVFMPALGNFIASFFPIFLVGALFGVMMTVTGYASAIAQAVIGVVGNKSAIGATVITCALMTYGGISVFIVAFVMYPLARELFLASDIPRRLIPATLALGAGTFTLTALPGTPAVQNIIPGQFFGTTAYAAPGIGIVAGTMMFGLGMWYLEYRKRTLIAAGEHFNSPESAPVIGGPSDDGSHAEESALAPNSRALAFVPLLTVFVVNFACTLVIFPALDWSYLDGEAFRGITLENRAGIWAVTLAVLAGTLVLMALNHKHFDVLRATLGDGVKRAMLPAFSTGSEVGYGAVIASLAGFAVVRDSMGDLGLNALWTSVIANNVTAGITGSSSGGMTIALNALGEQLQEQSMLRASAWRPCTASP